jgi:mannose-6-phosphate isomerase-like protein (cupin superfamily)
MSEYEVKKIDEMEAVYGGAFKRARAELGVSSFGMAIIDLPPSYEHYPEHDHAEDGQEEVFFALRGGGEIEIDGQRFPLDADHVARVAAGTKRKVWPGSEGLRLLALGGVPGGGYEAPDVSKLGNPDPLATA